MAKWSAKDLAKWFAMFCIGLYLFRLSGLYVMQYRLRTVVRDASAALNKHDLKYWWDFGTLLGIQRNGDIIWTEVDADISIMLEDRNRILTDPKVQRTLFEAGFIEVKDRGNYKLRIFDSWGGFLDMDVWQTEKNDKGEARMQMLTGRLKPEVYNVPEEFILPPGKLVLPAFSNVPLGVPRDAPALLQFWYGDWQVPRKFDKGRDASQDQLEVWIWNNLVYFYEVFVAAKIFGILLFNCFLYHKLLLVTVLAIGWGVCASAISLGFFRTCCPSLSLSFPGLFHTNPTIAKRELAV